MSTYHRHPEWAIEIPDFLPPQRPKDWLKIIALLCVPVAAMALVIWWFTY